MFKAYVENAQLFQRVAACCANPENKGFARQLMFRAIQNARTQRKVAAR